MRRVPTSTLALGGVLLTAAVLRLWAIDFGLPLVSARPDEKELLAATAGFPAGDLNPRFFVYPNLYAYVVWAWEELILGLRRLVRPTPPYAVMLKQDLPTLLLHGRLLSAVAGIATVWLVHRVVRRAGGTAMGLVAAALLATNWLHVRDSHFIKTEALLAAGIVVGLGSLARYVMVPNATRATLAGVAIGVAMGFKYPAVFLLVPAFVAGAMTSVRTGWRRLLPTPHVGLIATVAAVVFVVGSPFLFLDLARSRETIELLRGAIYATRADAVPPPDASWIESARIWVSSRTFAYHVTVSLRHGAGLLQTVALPLLALVAVASRKAQPLARLSAVFAVVFYLVAGASQTHLARYFTPLTPVVAILLAVGLVDLVDRLASARARQLVLAALTVALCAEPLASSVAGNRIGARTDTRTLATEWMKTELPRDAAVVQVGAAIVPVGIPRLPHGTRQVFRPGPVGGPGWRAVTHVVVQDHVLPFSDPRPDLLAAVNDGFEEVAEFSPYASEPAGWFEREDAYYVPFSQFSGVVRPGPVIRIFGRRRGAP